MFNSEVIKIAESKFNLNLSEIIIEEVQIGVFLTAVKLSIGGLGLALSDVNNQPYLYRDERRFDAFSPGQVKGRNLNELFLNRSNSGVLASLRISAINALSEFMISRSNFRISRRTDPLDLIALSKDKIFTVVGAFSSYIRKIQAASCKLNILELDKNAIRPESRQYFVHAYKSPEVLAASDVVIITGSTLVNNTLEKLLQKINRNTTVVVTGPSAGIYPEILFRRNVNLIGSTRINDEKQVMQVVREGGTGFHLFKYGAEKITYINEDYETIT
ncbi:MAG: DUF364 domain-containing protein [Bacteroidota bacterium]|nr:DUF364 domain-containing protein [Bacteroidota bacterium]